MNVQTRKQREVAERHSLFLSIGRELLESDGFNNLSMDGIAEIAEYSKGTVYQHFKCKEEVLIQLCNQCVTELIALFKRASQFNGNHRERLVSMFFAHDLWAHLNPTRFAMIQTLHADGIKDKVDVASLTEHNQLEAELISIVSGVVQDAANQGYLKLDESLNPVELVFGLWSLSYGGQLLQGYDIPLKDLGVRDPGQVLIRIASAILDGLGWMPLSSDFDYQHTLNRLATELFTDEVSTLKALKDCHASN
ncbi:MAG: TetR/AcrR family transcriptional regulator [Granulosicoccus sp.]|nr:TetR/AcrR family transcriptional regulator [Granulosicoccus sp.]